MWGVANKELPSLVFIYWMTGVFEKYSNFRLNDHVYFVLYANLLFFLEGVLWS